jgi:hypothetical protein
MNTDLVLDLVSDNLPPRGLRRVGDATCRSLYCRLGPNDHDLLLFLMFGGLRGFRAMRDRLKALAIERGGKDRR